MDDEKKFQVYLFRPRYWMQGDSGRRIGVGFLEPAEAADAAEAVLKAQGIPGQSYCELRFNGDKQPHTVVCFMEDQSFGIWNTEAVKWPIFYTDTSSMLDGFPFVEADDGNSWQKRDESENKEKSDSGDVKLDEVEDNGDDEDEIEQEDEAQEGDEEDADPEPEEDSGEDAEDDQDSSDESGDDSDDDSEDENGGEDSDSDSDEDGEDADSEGDEDGDGEDDEEEERPRLKIFAKFRGPLGWRKRAEAEELQEKNTFAVKFGIVDDEAEKPSQQEREVFAQVQFVERDDERDSGLLRLRMPDSVTLENFKQMKSGWYEVRIPYREDDAA